MTDPFVPAGGEPTERTFEWLHKWGQLVPLLDSNPTEAARLLEDRDRHAAQWVNAHGHDGGGEAAGGWPTEQSDWFLGADLDVAAGADQVLEFDFSQTLSSSPDVAFILEPGGAFTALHAGDYALIRSRWLVALTLMFEDANPGEWWDLRVEWSGDPTFAFIDGTRKLGRVETHVTSGSALSVAFPLVLANPAYWRYVVTFWAGATERAIIADPGPVVTHSLLWWSFIDE